MKVTAIRALVAKTRQVDPKDLGRDRFVYVDISAIDRDTKRIDAPQTVSAFEAPSRARKLIMTGDVLVSTVRPNLNAVALVGSAFNGEIASTGFCVLRPIESKLDSKYLYYFCQDQGFVDRLTRLSIGAGYPAVSDDNILDTEIPLPPLPEQQRIAGILSRADRLRRLRRYALEMSDGYLQAVFLEMFGDPATNPMGWEISQIGHLAEVKTGGTPSRELASFYGGSIPWVKTTEVVGSMIRSTSETLSESGLNASNCEVFPVGTIVVAMYGQGLTRGRSGLLGIAAATNQACAAILPSHKIETSYLWAYIKVSYNRLRDLGRGGNQPNLNLSMIRDFPVPLPPEAKRKAFVEIMRNHERLRAQQREALRQTEHLFQTLLHGAFRGEG